ncbi:MAG: gas vesicle protein [Bacillota bacterium]
MLEQTLKDVTLLEVVERLIEKGIVIHGDLLISLADIDLIYLGLKIVLTSTEKLQRP